MNWHSFVEEGLLRPAPDGRPDSTRVIRRAWDCVTEAREAYLASQWEDTDRELRRAFGVATEALARYNYVTTGEICTFDAARRIGTDYFGTRLADRIFNRASLLHEMLPLEPEIPEAQARLVRRSVAASSEYVALVECFTYQTDEM